MYINSFVGGVTQIGQATTFRHKQSLKGIKRIGCEQNVEV